MNDSAKRTPEYNINIWDLVWSVIFKWRTMVLVAFLMAVLFGGVTYYKDLKNAKNAQNNIPKTVEDFKLSDYSYTRANTYMHLLKLHDQQTEYQKNSYLMNLDANHFYLGRISYVVNPGEDVREQAVNTFLRQLKNAIYEEAFLRQIGEEIGANEKEMQYIPELICTDGKYQKQDKLYATSNDSENEQLLTVYVYYAQEEQCKKILELLQKQIQQKVQQLKKNDVRMELELVQQSCFLTADNDLLEVQNDLTYSLFEYYVALNGIKKDLAPEELNYVSVAMNKAGNEEAFSTQTDEIPQELNIHINMKSILAGFLFGIIIVCAVLMLCYLLNTKLRSDDDYETIYGIRLLGRDKTNVNSKKKIFGVIDKALQKIKNSGVNEIDDSRAIDMIASAIKVCSEQKKLQTIYVTGLSDFENRAVIVKVLQGKLDENKIVLVNGESILTAPQALEKAAEIGNIIFVEQSGVSRYKEIEREIDVCLQSGINMLGTIIVA